MTNVCIVGYGAIGPMHEKALLNTENARLYAVCDINPKRLSCLDPQIVTYTSFDEMLRDENIGSVHICTPHFLHFEMIKKALAAGKRVVCEKPVTMTRSEFCALLSLPGSENVCCVIQNRLNPAIKKLFALIESGKLGKLKTLKGTMTWQRDAEYYAQDSWRGKLSTEGGGVLINQAIHTLDLLCCIGGSVKSVCAKTANFSLPQLEVEDTCMARLNFSGGTCGIFFATNAYGTSTPAEVEACFENACVSYRGGKLFADGEVIAEDAVSAGGKAVWGSSHDELIKNFYDRNIYFKPSDVANTMFTMFAVYASAANFGIETETGGNPK